jgi:hypothetical protein
MVKKSNVCRFFDGKKLGGKRSLENLGVDWRDEWYLPSDRHNHINHIKLVVVRRQNSRLKLVANLRVSCLPTVDGKKTRGCTGTQVHRSYDVKSIHK